ncbi:MAG TPA: hypothetical protein VEJ18_11415, partial [Planctomycetota bacterium]|nr:hypothetical protein [Planctomycetota bacterium]
MTDAPTRATLGRGAAWALGGHVVSFAVPFVLIPWTLARVGTAEYGVWVQLVVLAGWLAHADLGLWTGIAKEVAERRARGDQEGLRTLFGTWIAVDAAAAVAILVAGFVASFFLQVPRPLLMAVAAQAATVPALRHLSYALAGLQRTDVPHRLGVVVAPLSLAAGILALETGWGLTGLAASGAVFGALQTLVLLRRATAAGLPVAGPRFRFGVFRRLLSAGWKLEAAELSRQAFRSDRLVLRWTGTSLEAVALYAVGFGLAERLTGVVALLSTAVMPAAADLNARGDLVRIRNLFLRGTKYHVLLGLLSLGFASLFAGELLILWLGKPMPDAVAVLRWGALGGVAVAVACCAMSVAVALGRPGMQLATTLASLALAAVLYSTWGRLYHGAGLAASVALGTVAGHVGFMIAFRRCLDFRWRELVGDALLRPAVAALPLAAVYAAWQGPAPRLPAIDGR